MEPPKGFGGPDKLDKVIKFLKRLYGLKQAPKTFSDTLRAGLIERGFTLSNHYPCLFMKEDIMCVVYIDDSIIAGPDSKHIDESAKDLGVNTQDYIHNFQLRDEGEVGDFLGIRIEKTGKRQFDLTQTELIDNVLKVSGMEESRPTNAPATESNLGTDKDEDTFTQSWKYATVVGILMYLCRKTRPDIVFAVHQ